MTAPSLVLSSTPGGDAGDVRCFTVTVDGRTLGLPVEAIHTVFEIAAVTPVPLAPREVMGLVNLRGNIATAVSLRRRLGIDPKAPETSRLAVGIEHGGESFALVVDDVGDVIPLDRGTQIECPSSLGTEAERFASVHRLEDRILPVLNLGWTFAFDTHAEPSARAFRDTA